jgi:hypothetical protein
MVLLGASGGTTPSLSLAIIEDVDELIGVSNRLPKNALEVSSLPLPFLTQMLMHSKTKQIKVTK